MGVFMRLLTRVTRVFRRVFFPVFGWLAPVRYKEFNELRYWKGRKKAEGTLSNAHYVHFYTAHFGLDPAYYQGKVLLDIGCGPRGSLEWASMARRRIGLDPLASDYLRLGASSHRMEYIAAPSEQIPLDTSSCDAVFSFNSLDHVEDVARTIEEIKRVTRPGGIFLLLVEINHPPTACEPHDLNPDMLVNLLKPEFSCESASVYRSVADGMYKSIKAGETVPEPMAMREQGYFSARFLRNAVPAGAGAGASD